MTTVSAAPPAGPVQVSPADRLLQLSGKLQRYASRYEDARDSRCVFTHTYALMTAILGRELATKEWSEVEWVVVLAESFAARYFTALDSFDRNQDPGLAWRRIFEEINDRATSVVEDMAAGMTGHIVHDLPYALLDAGFQSPDHAATRISDYHRVNDILTSAIDPIIDSVTARYNPWLRWLDRLGRKDIDVLTSYGIRVSRGMAWYNAVRLGDPAERERAREAIEQSPRQFLQLLFRPRAWSLRFLIRALDAAISLGRRWPRPEPYSASWPARLLPNQTYYSTGVGNWTGSFTFRVTGWPRFWSARLGFQNRVLVIGMALLMGLLRRARITSTIVGYPDQNEAGVATNLVRISAFGMTLYLLREEYILSPDGTQVCVRSSERFGPVRFLFNREKAHPAEVREGGERATYFIPLLGASWIGEYEVLQNGHHIQSLLTCEWAEARESIDRVRP
ncbi:MAG TPA: DUF5995 family protein [Gemmatimonadales bacterium]|nr:DUF5995 family protein [Gemmatimonadales bacterium]